MIAWPGHDKCDLAYSIGQLQPTLVETLRWGKDNLTGLLGDVYLEVDCEGVPLILRKGSNNILWDETVSKVMGPEGRPWLDAGTDRQGHAGGS